MGGWTAMMSNPKVDAIVETYLSVADAEAPGLVEGLYLEGLVREAYRILPLSQRAQVDALATHLGLVGFRVGEL